MVRGGYGVKGEHCHGMGKVWEGFGNGLMGSGIGLLRFNKVLVIGCPWNTVTYQSEVKVHKVYKVYIGCASYIANTP